MTQISQFNRTLDPDKNTMKNPCVYKKTIGNKLDDTLIIKKYNLLELCNIILCEI